MAIGITVLNDNNHSISATKPIISRQSELGEVCTFTVPAALFATYPLAYINYISADGKSYFFDNSGVGFNYSTGSFTYTLGTNDSMMDADGRLGIQIVLRDLAPPNQTKEWRSRILYVTVENSVIATEDASSGMISSLAYGALGSINDVDLTGLADLDMLYRNTTTGKWEDLTLVAGSNITLTFNKTTGTLQVDASGTVSTYAVNSILTDSAGRYTATEVENALAEIAGAGRTTETVKSVSDASVKNTGNETIAGIKTFSSSPIVPTLTATDDSTKGASTAFVHDAVINDLNVSGTAPIYACRAWVNFNGTGTVAIRASGNVSSITDNGVGDYILNFTTGFTDINYAVVASCSTAFTVVPKTDTPITTAIRIGTYQDSGAAYDPQWVNVAIFR